MVVNANTGAALRVLVAMATIGLIDTTIPLLAKDAGLWQFHLVRGAIVLPTLMAVALFTKRAIWPKSLGAVALRSCLVALAMMIYFGCLAFLPVGQVAAGLFTAPIFVLILSVTLLKQPFVAVQAGAIAIGFAGLVLILDVGQGILLLTFLPVVAGLFYAFGALCTRHLCAQEEVLSLLFGFFLVMCAMGAIGVGVFAAFPDLADGSFVRRGWEVPTSTFWAITLLQAYGSVFAVGMLTRAYQLGSTATVSAFEFSLMVFASLWGFALLGQILTLPMLLGMGLIVMSGVAILRTNREVKA